jgi:hypothetical protein
MSVTVWSHSLPNLTFTVSCKRILPIIVRMKRGYGRMYCRTDGRITHVVTSRNVILRSYQRFIHLS